jgi:hypothetical protein
VDPADWYAMTGTPWIARPEMGLRRSRPSPVAALTALQGLRDKGRTYALGEAAHAFRYLGEGHARGKLVVTV